jgi:hypothetical protein
MTTIMEVELCPHSVGAGVGGRQMACKSEIDASLAQQVAPKADVRPHMTSTM